MKRFIALFIPLLVMLASCEKEYSPKPRAYPRIALPVAEYSTPDTNYWNCPYIFELSDQSALTVDPRYQDSTCWYNLYYPELRATVHLTYTALNNNLSKHIEQNRKLAMKHIVKAVGIPEFIVEHEERRVYGIIYDFKGETASDMQFFLTDSTDHFLRGALYFSTNPNKDSLAPAIDYVKQDIRHLIDSFHWQE